jgi:hypothetical protein
MKNSSPIRSNSQGKLWIETKDFFNQPKIQSMVKKLLNSNLVKEIENK